MFGRAAEVEIDSIGRILIPDFLKSYGQLQTKVVLAGIHNRLEVWDEKRWGAYKSEVEKQADALAQKLGEIGVF